MGIFDRWGRGKAPGASAPDPVMPPAASATADEQALARYRYLLRTAPPEAIEQAHAEAFAQLSPEQRRLALAAMSREVPEPERQAMQRDGASATALARAATRAELRRPGAMERMFGSAGTATAPGLGGLMAGTMLSSMAGMVLGSAIAHHFFDHDTASSAPDLAAADGDVLRTADDPWTDADADAGGFDDGGSFDV